MTPEQFCYWLRGRDELMPDTPPSDAEWKMISEHLVAVFVRTAPTKPDVGLQDAIKRFQEIHAKKDGIAPRPEYLSPEQNRVYCQNVTQAIGGCIA